MNIGVTTVSFRNKSIDEIIDKIKQTKLNCIEIGGDVHCKPNDIKQARRIKALCDNAKLEICSYGSYYRLGNYNNKFEEEFNSIYKTSQVLNCNIIRIWGYTKPSIEITKSEYDMLVNECKTICDIASDKTICFECHNGTLSDNYKYALGFINDVNKTNLKMYFQPNQYMSEKYNIEAATALADITQVVHVFQWDEKNKYSLESGVDIWKKYIYLLPNKYYILEFMPDDKLDTLCQEVKCLLKILK